MNIKNYTTEVPAIRSVQNIENLLVSFGSTNIMKEYGPTGSLAAISFLVEMDGLKLPFLLPAKVDNIYLWLKRKQTKTAERTLLEKAERIAWKQMHEWVHMQLSQIELDQLEKLQAFMPYLYDIEKRETYYHRLKSGGFKALLPPSK